MRKKTKRLFMVMLMVMALAISPNSIVRAEDTDVNYDDEIALAYTNLSSISASIAVSSNGIASCTGNVTVSKNLNSRVYISLLKSSSSGAYSRINVWAQSYSGKGLKSLTKSMNVSKGYKYRIKVEVRIYNSAGSVIETAETYSAIVNYT